MRKTCTTAPRAARSASPARGSLALALAGLPLGALGQGASPALAELNITCTTHPQVAEFIETGSSVTAFHFDSAEASGARRVCFRNRYDESYFPPRSLPPDAETLFYPVLGPPYVFAEGDASGTSFGLELTRYGSGSSLASLSYAVSGSARLGEDYVFTEVSDGRETRGELTFDEGAPRTRVLAIDILDDEEPEPPETIEIIFHSPWAAAGTADLAPPRRIELVILDNEALPTRFEPGYRCEQQTPSTEVWQDGSSIYYTRTGSSLTEVNFLGGEGRTQADMRCWRNLVPSIAPLGERSEGTPTQPSAAGDPANDSGRISESGSGGSGVPEGKGIPGPSSMEAPGQPTTRARNASLTDSWSLAFSSLFVGLGGVLFRAQGGGGAGGIRRFLRRRRNHRAD